MYNLNTKNDLQQPKEKFDLKKEISQIDFSKDFALEYEVYFGKGEGYDGNMFVHLFLGKEGSPINLLMKREPCFFVVFQGKQYLMKQDCLKT